MKLWYAEGLEKAIINENEIDWLKKYFEANKEEICFGGCQTIVTIENNDKYYTIEMNGNDDQEMSFIIQNENLENLNIFWTANKNECIRLAFKEAFQVFNEYVGELKLNNSN